MFERKVMPTHPGKLLLDEFLKPNKITQRQLADDLDIPFKTINDIVNGKEPLTTEIAKLIAKYLGTSKELWIGLQEDYDYYAKKFANKKKSKAKAKA